MLLNNFIKAIGLIFNDKFSNSTIFIDTNGNSYSDTTPGSFLMNGMKSYGRIAIGTGVDPTVSSNDYSLDDSIDLTLVSRSASGYPVDNIAFTMQTTYRNDTDSAVTVTNIGILARPMVSQVYTPILVTKEILETPVTIQPGESYTFTSIIGA